MTTQKDDSACMQIVRETAAAAKVSFARALKTRSEAFETQGGSGKSLAFRSWSSKAITDALAASKAFTNAFGGEHDRDIHDTFFITCGKMTQCTICELCVSATELEVVAALEFANALRSQEHSDPGKAAYEATMARFDANDKCCYEVLQAANGESKITVAERAAETVRKTLELYNACSVYRSGAGAAAP